MSDRHVLVAVKAQDRLVPLLALGCALARPNGRVTVLTVTPDGVQPDWLHLPESHGGVSIHAQVRRDEDAGRGILTATRQLSPDLLLLGWEGDVDRGRRLLNGPLDTAMRRAPCTTLVVRQKGRPSEPDDERPLAQRLDEAMAQIGSVAVPAAGGPNAGLAIQLGLDLGPETEVTALFIARSSLGEEAVALGHQRLLGILGPWADEPRVKPLVVRSESIVEGILQEAVHHDLMFVGATEESMVERALFGNIPQQIATESAVPVIVVRRGIGQLPSLLRQLRWSLFEALPKLETSERAEIYLSIWRGARPRIDFFVMIALAAAIAALGLLQSSPAVIIGAMLVAPLMSAVIGLGLGVVQGDVRLLRVALRATLRGAGLALVVGLAMGLLIPREGATAEMLARTQPTLLDLAVALVSGAAAAYALSRRGVSNSLPGVAIAAALVPPLATAGLCAAQGLWTLSAGGVLLFVANLIAINAAGGLVFLWLGFGPGSSEKAQRRVLRRGLAGFAVLLIAVSLALGAVTLRGRQETAAQNDIQRALLVKVSQMNEVELAEWSQTGAAEPVLWLEVTVRSTREVSPEDAKELQRRLAIALDRPVALTLTVVPTRKLAPIIPIQSPKPGASR